MEYFTNTFLVVVGILLPFVIVLGLIWLASVIKELVENRGYKLAAKLAEVKKQPPYDEVEVSQPPNVNMFTLKLVKNDEVVWEQSYDKDLKPEP